MELRPAILIRSGGLSLATGVSSSPEIVEALTTRYSVPGRACSTSRSGSSARASPTTTTTVTRAQHRIPPALPDGARHSRVTSEFDRGGKRTLGKAVRAVAVAFAEHPVCTGFAAH